MIERKLQWKVALGFVCAILLTGTLDFLSWRSKKAASDESDSITYGYTVMRQLELILGDVVDIETGARGFAATDKDQFLDLYDSGQSELAKHFAALRELNASGNDSAQWLAALTDDVTSSVSFSKQLVSGRRISGDAPPASSFQQSRNLVEIVRDKIHAQQSAQTKILAGRGLRRNIKGKRSNLVMAASTITVLTLLLFSWAAANRSLAVSAQAQKQIQSSNLELERGVTDRTSQLSEQTQLLAQSGAALRAESRTLQTVLDNMKEGLTAADIEGTFSIWNRAAENILGLDAKKGLPIPDWPAEYGLYQPDGETLFHSSQLPMVRAMQGESSDTEMFVRNSARPKGVWIEVSARPLKDEAGTIRGALATFRDVSRRKRDEREIQLLNEELEERVAQRTAQLEAANKELEAFTYSVSHDLRAPLRHIGGFSQILIEEYGPTMVPQAAKYLERIAQGSRRMGILVDELLALAGVGRHVLSVEPAGLNLMVEEVAAILTPESKGRLVEWKIADLGTVNCDVVLVRQVFQNLISNSLKFTRPRATAVIEIGHVPNAPHPTFFVRDNGVGFDMKYSDKLFGVFQRLHRIEDFEGTGIGLATVRRIVQKHGGEVWAEAEPDKGATFYFTFDLPVEIENKMASIVVEVKS